jgi:spore germination cell wall hydrolase CwlJ-like protein
MKRFTAALLIATGSYLLTSAALAEDLLQHHCLAEAMYFEARNQGTIGMMAVGTVILTRVGHSRYPDTICEVVHQGVYWEGNPVRDKCQFSYWCDGKPEKFYEKKAWEEAKYTAALLLFTKIKVAGVEQATHYHAEEVTPWWSTFLQPCAKIGQHIFYIEP